MRVFNNTVNTVVFSFSMSMVVLLFFFIPAQPVYAQSYHIPLGTSKSASQVLENNYHVSRFYFSFQGLDAFEVSTDKGVFTELILNKGHAVGEPGKPRLPASNSLVEIPMGANVELVIKSYSVTDIPLSEFGIHQPLMPVQPSLLKTLDKENIPFYYLPEAYKETTYTDHDVVDIEILGMLRGTRIARLTVAPVAYNPGENSIRVFNDIEVELRYSESDLHLSGFAKASTHSPYFDIVYKQLLNPFDTQSSLKAYPDLSRTPIKMLVISHSDFRETLQPLIAWHTRKGYKVIEAYTSTIGYTPEAIKAFIHNTFQQSHPGNPAPTFLMLIGDPSKLPASAIGTASKEVTDLYYASVDGDIFPDMYYGRLSARNTTELKNQIDKILYYQTYSFKNPSYLDDVTLIAGEDSFWNQQVLQPTVKYATNNYYNTSNGFTRVNAFMTNYTGSYSSQNTSVGYINYTGHCYPTEWYSPRLQASNIPQINNTGMYPLVIGNCCQSALFSHSESIAEAWVRAKDRGAVAYIGSAPDTHWFEDFYWSVGAFPIVGNNAGYVPTASETTLGAYDAPFVADYVPVGAIQFIGNLSITQANIRGYQTQSNTTWYWEGYHTFGDPSTVIYQKQGKENNVRHFPVIPLGAESFVVEALPGSYVGLSVEGTLIAAGQVDESGALALPIQSIISQGTASIVVTKPQYIPYIRDISIASLDGPYIVLDQFNINDQANNNNELAEYGEDISLHLTIKNIGASPVGPLTAQLSGGDEFVSIAEPGTHINIPALDVTLGKDTVTVFNTFALNISEQVPNEHITSFQLIVTDGTARWRSDFRLTAFAPELQINNIFFIDDSQTGNKNGRLDQGETANISFKLTNKGGATSNNPFAYLQSPSEHLHILESVYQGQPIDPGNSMYATFSIRASYHAENGTNAPITLSVEDGSTTSLDTGVIIGYMPNVTIGNEKIPSGQYPFYNIYKANRSQLLFLSDELGPGAKKITSLGFDILQFSTQYNAFPNFKILIKHTNLEAFDNAFVDMSGATVVYSSNLYHMPQKTGWHTWPIEHFEHNGFQNIIIEIVWGSLPGWTTNFYKVASTAYSANRVAYGYSDITSVPSYNGMSYLRPNIALTFTADPIPIPWPVTFEVTDDSGNALKDILIKVDDMIKSTNAIGEAVFELLPGAYTFSAWEQDSAPFAEESFTVSDQEMTIPIVLNRYYKAHFFVKDEHKQTISDATINLNGKKHEPGNYLITELKSGFYEYIVSRESYFDQTGSFRIEGEDATIEVTMREDNTRVSPEDPGDAFKVFPVPARDQLFVTIPTPGQAATISLHNSQGQKVQQYFIERHTNPGNLKFNIWGLSPGMYYVKMQTVDQTAIRKVIIH
jgi:hypothetical protein